MQQRPRRREVRATATRVWVYPTSARGLRLDDVIVLWRAWGSEVCPEWAE